jgi:choline kinase/SAM-dependent methyltransferase
VAEGVGQCVILAGGRGERLRPLTDDVPKALVPVAGEPFAFHQLRWLAGQGVDEVVYCLGYRAADLRAAVGDGRRFGLQVEYVDEGEDLRGTGGALRLALERGVLAEELAVLYGDSYLSLDLSAAWDAFRTSGLPALMTVFRNDGRWDRSNARFEEGRVTLYDKHGREAGAAGLAWIDYGLSILTRELVAERIPTGRSDLAELFFDLSREGRLAGFEATERFYEIGSFAGLRELEEHLAESAARDDWDRHWDEFAVAAAANPAQEYRRGLVVGLLGRAGPPPARIVDVGAGTGDLAAALREAFPSAEILGVDVSDSGLAAARRKVPDAIFLRTDLLREAAGAGLRGWATHAVCSEVLEHVDDPERLLANARSYLAPGCRLVVTVPGGPMSAFDRHIGHRQHFTACDLRTLLEQSGYAVELATGAGFPFFNLYRRVVIARGERLAADVAGASSSPLARAAMAVFGVLFRLNLTSSPWGWQTVGYALVPASGKDGQTSSRDPR